MAPNRGRNRAKDLESLAQSDARDFDPEEDPASESDGSHGRSDLEHDENGGREHYIEVGKSSLRQPKDVPLGPQYRGSRVGRNAILEVDGEDDPFNHDFDDGDSESDALEYEDDRSDSEELGGSDGDDGRATSDTDLSDEEAEHPIARQTKPGESVKEQLRKGLDSDAQRAMTASISQASKEDAGKGRAVKRQRSAFDSLLSVRMKLQRSLVATNTISGTSSEQLAADRGDAAQACEAAETAAFKLWNSLTALRDDLTAIRAGQKRKRPHFSSHDSTEELLGYMQGQETESRSLRDAILRKWSNKSQGPTAFPERSRLNRSEHRATIIDVLQEQLSNTERLVKRTQAPRSCAPLQASRRITEDETIYDDADFYGLLLKELLEQKSQDRVATSNIDLGFQMRREAKTKRNVDTRASKGRKLRYTVHEKLQNFMAPEDRTSWGQRQVDDLFGSMFGQRLGLAEDEVEMEDGNEPEENGLTLFSK